MTAYSALIVDGVLAFLLLGVIIVSTIVYRRLGTIRSGQAELRELVDNLNTAVLDAQRSVSNMKHAAADVEAQLKLETQKARAIADELSLITEAGNNLATRIEKGLTGKPSPAPEDAGGAAAEARTSHKEQQELLAALKEAR